MNWLSKLIPENVLESLGWTFVDSLWLGLVLTITVWLFIKLFKINNAPIKYWLYAGTMVLLIIVTVVSFAFHSTVEQQYFTNQESNDSIFSILSVSDKNSSVFISYQYWENLLIPIFPWIVSFWIIGAFAFTIRLLGGLYYVQRLKATAIAVQSQIWLTQLDQLKSRLGINKAILMLETSRIDVPMVAGHLKPVLYIPLGLFTNLSPNQIETLLLHELAHIKRHDYLINLIQSALEVVLFFNPAVWFLSAQVRKEREHCCDDIAVASGIDAMDYARALTLIQQSFINNKNSIAMALAKNNNKLLIRIKRLLGTELSTQNNTWAKLVVILLLVIGLFGFSWISSSDKKKLDDNNAKDPALEELTLPITPKSLFRISPDTTITESHSTSLQIVWRDDEGNIVEYIEESADSDDLELPKLDMALSFPDLDLVANVDPSIDAKFDLDPDIDVMIDPDINSIVDRVFDRLDNDFMRSMDFHWNDTLPSKDFDEREVMRHVEMELKRVFEEHKRSMHELQLHMEKMHSLESNEMTEKQLKESKEKMEQMQKQMHDNQMYIKKRHKKMLEESHERMKEQEFSLRRAENELKRAEQEIARHQEEIKELEKKMNTFEKELAKELRKDGYLKNNEDLSNFSIKNGDRMEVNGKSIRKDDLKKYEELRKKYLGDD